MEPACSPETRRLAIERLRRETFDALVLGGGINGAGVARDLCLRGLRVALVEQRHFASGTSGKNSQLIHGGLRYLKNLEFRLVREALHERAVLLGLAPHLVEPLAFLMPFYSGIARLYYSVGLLFYDTLAGSRRIQRHRSLSRAEAVRMEPGLAAGGLAGAALFSDARVHAARFVLANVWDAIRNGAAAVNYMKAVRWMRNGAVWRVELEDTLTGQKHETRARKLVDTTGPWSRAGELRLVRGSHLVLPRVNAGDHAIAWFDESGRIVFIIPWGENNDRSLVGTTDVDHRAGPDEVRIAADEAAYLLGVVKRLFPQADLEPVAAYSSLRPLVRDESSSATRTSREHRIWNTSDGVLHVAGGKYTTYRVMSEQAADMVARELAPELEGVHRSAETPLDGHTREAIAAASAAAPHEARLYGAQAGALLACLPEAPPPGLSAMQAARIVFAVRHEMAQRLADLMFVSTYWGYEQEWTGERLEPYAQEMGRLLGWDQRRREEEMSLVLCASAPPGRA